MLISSTSAEALARFGHALSEPIRTQVLLTLRAGPAYPADVVGVSRPAMSNHLAFLRGCGLVVEVPAATASSASTVSANAVVTA